MFNMQTSVLTVAEQIEMVATLRFAMTYGCLAPRGKKMSHDDPLYGERLDQCRADARASVTGIPQVRRARVSVGGRIFA